MSSVPVTEFRRHFASYLERVQRGEELELTSHGKVVARIGPPADRKVEARRFLAQVRETATFTDLESPIDAEWDADVGR